MSLGAFDLAGLEEPGAHYTKTNVNVIIFILGSGRLISQYPLYYLLAGTVKGDFPNHALRKHYPL